MEQDMNYQKLSDLMSKMLQSGCDPKEMEDHVHHILDEYNTESKEDPKEEAAESPDEEMAEDMEEKPRPKGKMPKGKVPLSGLTIILGHSKK